MTEQQWLLASSIARRIQIAARLRSYRKLLLFGTACCYRLWPLLPGVCKSALPAIERDADGLATPPQMARFSRKPREDS